VVDLLDFFHYFLVDLLLRLLVYWLLLEFGRNLEGGRVLFLQVRTFFLHICYNP
jgi:hypothetical protein